MFKWYKNLQKKRYEEKIKDCIKYNNYRIKQFKSYPDFKKDLLIWYKDCDCICKCYNPEFLNKICKKYNVSSELTKQVLESEYIVLEEKNNMQERIKKTKKEKETRKKIDLYKRAIFEAILELKEEGKI
ncbi:hypothetical protein CF087_20580 [Clostridium botulinum]|nr:hypothetical protein [Clostridium botulinum]